ncbi:hypothetical protein NDU88_000953, partial [Pleurodeles waltl]
NLVKHGGKDRIKGQLQHHRRLLAKVISTRPGSPLATPPSMDFPGVPGSTWSSFDCLGPRFIDFCQDS